MSMTQLSSMRAGQSGSVAGLEGGLGLKRKLENMGVRPGVRITKVNSQIMRGPVIIRVGGTRLAIGHRMARRIMVDVD